MPKVKPETHSGKIVSEVLGPPQGSDFQPGPGPTDGGDSETYGFVPLEDATEFVNGVWYGPEGTGKTTAVLSMANLGRTLLVNAEGGAKVSALKKRGIDTSNIQIWPPPGTRASFDGLEQLFYQLEAELSRDPAAWFGVVFDSGTEVTLLLREDQTAHELATDAKRTDRWMVDRNDWRVMSDQMRVLIRRFRDLPCHFALTALERQDDVKLDTGEEFPQWGPAVNPGLQSDLMGYVDLVIRCTSTELVTADGPVSEFVGNTRKTRQYRAKDRFDATPRQLANPSFLRVLSYVREELTEADDPDQTAWRQLRSDAAGYASAAAAAKEAGKQAARSANARKAAPAKVTAS